MKKSVILASVVLSLFLLLSTIISASSIDDEIQKITHYAEEYETGNINYIQLWVYTSAARQNLNEILGASGKEEGGLLKQEQLKPVLGEPREIRRWVWVEKEEREKRVDYDVPVWEKIIFDGKKIQIKLEAWPSLFTKKDTEELVYRLNFMINFKKPEEELAINEKINNIKSLAEIFNSDPSSANAEALAEESVNVERNFESYYRQNPGKCEDIMKSVFGIENQRQSQKLFVQQISFYQGKDFEVIARLEMCDDCEWNWINLDLWLEGRGPGFKMREENFETFSPKDFVNMESSFIKEELTNLLNEIKQCFEQGKSSECLFKKQKLNALNNAWNDKSNNVWPEVDKEFQSKIISLSPEEMQKFNENYGWIKQEQEKRKRVKELMKKNYEERKQFYLSLFSNHEKKEYYYEQIEFEKRLIEEFKEFGEEICDNNKDDNNNEKVDCGDGQCGGKFCGKGTKTLQDGNETKEIEIDLYCISGECKAREEIIKEKSVICGNHICEGNETKENCAEDCFLCPQYPAINCSGKVIFKGKDENNCPLEPICLEEETCSVNEDCKFLCGDGECIKGKCKVKGLRECEEAQCVAGDKKILNCQTGEQVVIEECIEGLWLKTGIECEIREENRTEDSCNSYCLTQPRLMCEGDWQISGNYPDCNCNWVCQAEDIVRDECATREDCGGESDVCSNRRCVTIPEAIPTEPEAEQPEIETEVEEEETTQSEHPETEEPSQEAEQPEVEQPEPAGESAPGQETPTTGEIIFAFFRTLLSRAKITGADITGFQTEETTPLSETEPSTQPEPTQENQPLQDNQPPLEYDQPPVNNQQPENQPIQEQPPQDYQPIIEERTDENRNWEVEEEQRRREEQEERCEKECNRPCIEKCIRENCGEEMDCNVDEESKKCGETCKPDDSCIKKCMQGGDWWKEFENKDEHKEEKGVFKAGGNCRTSQGKTEAFIYFDGWGEPFEKIQPLKQKYYSGGQADWCEQDLENLKKQRREFEKGFNQEFVTWFFEKYLANSAENWEQQVSGIFELYWKDVDTSREMAYRMNCLGINEIPEHNLINVKYETQNGKIELWEEIKTAKLPGLDKEVQVISPYMKIWIFPPKEFIIYEMKKGMKNHEFPGPPEDKTERKNEEGPTEEEKGILNQDKNFMKKIKTISEKYGGNLDAVVQFKNYETNEVVFNLHVQVNEEDILKMKPMLPEEAPAEDVKAEIDFELIYDMIYSQEKEMAGERTESPPWDRRIQPVQKIKETVNGVKMYFKVRKIMSSAKITPESAEDDVKSLFKTFFNMMGKAERGKNQEEENVINENVKDIENEVLEPKEKITGEIVKWKN